MVKKEKIKTRAKSLYEQCKNIYNEHYGEPDAEHPSIPDTFDDDYHVPEELLFKELCRYEPAMEMMHEEYRMRLFRAVSHNDNFDINVLTAIAKNHPREYHIFFEVYFKDATGNIAKKLFTRQLKLDGAVFKWCSRKHFAQVAYGATAGCIDQSAYIDTRNLLFPEISANRLSNMHAVEGIVYASDFMEAVNRIDDIFRTYMACVNFTQSFKCRTVTHVGIKPLKLLAFMTHAGVFIGEEEGKTSIAYNLKRQHELPMDDFVPSKDKLTRFMARAALSNTPAGNRLKNTLRNFESACEDQDPSHRQLDFWKCLETASAKTGRSRQEDDIIKIFANYKPDSIAWRQMGGLIRETRNLYVHQGVTNSTEDMIEYHIGWAKLYAESAIKILLFLYKHRDRWKTNEDIDIFFDNFSKSSKELKDARDLLRFRA